MKCIKITKMCFKEKKGGLAGIFKRSSSIDNLFDEVSAQSPTFTYSPELFVIVFMNIQYFSINTKKFVLTLCFRCMYFIIL